MMFATPTRQEHYVVNVYHGTVCEYTGGKPNTTDYWCKALATFSVIQGYGHPAFLCDQHYHNLASPEEDYNK